MNRFQMIDGSLYRRVTLLDTSDPTLKELKEAIEAAEKLSYPSVDISSSYDSATLTIGGYVAASETEVLVFEGEQRRLERQQEKDLRKRFEELKARFEPSLKASR